MTDPKLKAPSTSIQVFLNPQFFVADLKFARPHVAYSNRICLSTCFRIYSSIQDSTVNIVNRAFTKTNYIRKFGDKFITSYIASFFLC